MSAFINHITSAYLRRLGARSVWTEGGHGRMHALELEGRGDLPTIVLLHGLSARSTHFAGVVHHLRGRYRRVLIPDLLGHGQSAVPDGPLPGPVMRAALFEQLDTLTDDRERLIIYGNSLGGYGAIRIAEAYPDRVVALIVNSPGGGPLGEEMTMQDYLDRFRITTHAEAMAFTRVYFGRSLSLLRGVFAQSVLGQLASPAVQKFMNEVDESDFLTPDMLSRLVMPTLMLWGQQDGIMVPHQLRFFEEHLPDHARLVRPERYGHAPYIEHFGDLARRILAFVDETLPRAA